MSQQVITPGAAISAPAARDIINANFAENYASIGVLFSGVSGLTSRVEDLENAPAPTIDWNSLPGKPFTFVSWGGQGIGDAGKAAIFDMNGGLSVSTLNIRSFGLGINVSTAQNGSEKLLTTRYGAGETDLGLEILYDGTLCFPNTISPTVDAEAEPTWIKVKIQGNVYYLSAVPLASPTNTLAPEITGTLTVGSELTCSDGGWTGDDITFSYQWYLNSVAVGEDSNTFTPEEAGDVYCAVTATNPGGYAEEDSNIVSITEAEL